MRAPRGAASLSPVILRRRRSPTRRDRVSRAAHNVVVSLVAAGWLVRRMARHARG
jgi:hypothetical protein